MVRDHHHSYLCSELSVIGCEMPSEKKDLEKSKKSKSTLSESANDAVQRIQSAAYFMDWTKNVLTQYGSSVWELYVGPLNELCTRQKDEANVLKNDLNMLDQETVHVDAKGRKAFREAVQKAHKWPTIEGNYKPVTQDRFLTMAEAACFYRLKQTVKVLGSLVAVLGRFKEWIENNMKLLQKHSNECALILGPVMLAFDAACTLAEVFVLLPVDRSSCASKHAKFLTAYDVPEMKNMNQPLEILAEVRDYEKKLETQAGYFRTAVYLSGKAMIDISEHMLLSFQNSFLESTTSETKMILDRLPGQFMYPEPLMLSTYAMQVLMNPPPNKYSLSATREILEEYSLVDGSYSTKSLRTASTRTKTESQMRTERSKSKTEGSERKSSAPQCDEKTQMSSSLRNSDSPPTARNVRSS